MTYKIIEKGDSCHSTISLLFFRSYLLSLFEGFNQARKNLSLGKSREVSGTEKNLKEASQEKGKVIKHSKVRKREPLQREDEWDGNEGRRGKSQQTVRQAEGRLVMKRFFFWQQVQLVLFLRDFVNHLNNQLIPKEGTQFIYLLLQDKWP